MSNENRPMGLRPSQYLNGAPWTGGGRMYCIPSTDTNAFAPGDPVVLAGSSDSRGIATITLATAGSGNSILGAIVGGGGSPVFGGSYGVPADTPVVIPATKTRAYYVFVCDDPNVIFTVQEASAGTQLSATSVGLNANLQSGTNNGYMSGWQLNPASSGSGSTLQVKLLGLDTTVSAAFGAYAKWLVLINNHCYRIGQAGY